MSTKSYWEKIERRDENKKIKKQRDEYHDKFNKAFEEYSKDKPPVKCLSDKGLLYLRYGIDKLRNFHGKDYIKWREELEREECGEYAISFTDFCTEFYNEKIRGNMEFTNKSMVSIASAVLYICCCMKRLNVTQKDVAEVYHVTEVRIRNNYKYLRKELSL